jgi:ABC-type amino acid transport substrate-binding protein
MPLIKLKRFFCIIIVFIFSASWCYAESRKIYTVGVENINYMPYYSGSSKKESFHGYSKDVLDLFAKHNNIKFTYIPMPVKRLFLEFIQNRSVDFKYPDNPAWSTDYWAELKGHAEIYYSDPDVITQTGVAVLQKNNLKPLEICEKFGLIRGFTPQSYLEFLSGENISIVNPPDIESLISILLIGRVNCIYISKEVLNYNLKKVFKEKGAVLFQDKLPYDTQTFSLSSVLHPELIDAYNIFLKDNEFKHEINKIRENYGLPKL